MQQNTEFWDQWRLDGIGSSDAPIIMGVSPWMTPRDLWLEKTGRQKREADPFITERGHYLEPKIRSKLELFLLPEEIDFPPAVFQHYQYDFLRASLDGWNEERKTVAEFKYVGRADFENAQSGKVPEKYWPQVQHQIIVSGATKNLYCSYFWEKGASYSSGALAVISVYPDFDWIRSYIPKAIEFWEYVKSDTPPPLSDRDYKTVEKNLDVARELIPLKDIPAKEQTRDQKIAIKRLQAILECSDPHPRLIFGDTGVKMITVKKGVGSFKKFTIT